MLWFMLLLLSNAVTGQNPNEVCGCVQGDQCRHPARPPISVINVNSPPVNQQCERNFVYCCFPEGTDIRFGLIATTQGQPPRQPVTGEICECHSRSDCSESNTDGSGIISIRVEPRPPPGVTCNSRQLYCCYKRSINPPSPNMKSFCGCSSRQECKTLTNSGEGIIDIRVISRPPSGVQCPPQEVYCCSNNETPVPPGPSQPCETSSNPVRPASCPAPSNRGFFGTRQTGIRVGNHVTREPEANFGEYPWLCLLLKQDDTFVGQAAIIDNRHALTTAHTVADQSNMKLRCGEWDARANYEPCPCWETRVTRVFSHHEFNGENLHNNVAVVEFETKLPRVYPHLNPVTVPQQGARYPHGQRCWVAGFGKDQFGDSGRFQEIMKEVELPLVEHGLCQDQLRNTELGGDFVLDSSFVCAGGEAGRDACEGDRGAPLVCRNQATGKFDVVGLVSWGIDCGRPGVPAVYANVAEFRHWIEDQIFKN